MQQDEKQLEAAIAAEIANTDTMPQSEKDKFQKPQKQRVHRVGSLTMGAALIITGTALCACLLVPTADILLVAKLAPLLLVALGLEVIVAAAKNDGGKLKYDLLSVFMCFIIIFGAIGASLLPTLFKYFGPAREAAVLSIEREVQKHFSEEIDQYPGLYEVTVRVSFNELRDFTGQETIQDLKPNDWMYVFAKFEAGYASAEEFAAAVLPVYTEMCKINGGAMQFSAESQTKDGNPYYEFNASGRLLTNITKEKLAQITTQYVYNSQLNSYMSTPEMKSWQAEQERLEKDRLEQEAREDKERTDSSNSATDNESIPTSNSVA